VLVRNSRRRSASWVRVGLGVLVCLGAATRASAQFVNNVCGTSQGTICAANPAPVGSPCGCITPKGLFPGQIIESNAPPVARVCRTFSNVCPTSPAPIGSPCVCFGDPGSAVLR
jgi:hypothetical protein